MFNDIVSFYFFSTDRGETKCVPDPFLQTDEGVLLWKDIPIVYERSKESYSFNQTYISEINLKDGAANYAKTYFEAYAPNGDLGLRVFVKNPQSLNEEDIKIYEGYFDMSFIEDDGTIIKLKLQEGGLNEIIKTQLTEKFELDRQTDINGNSITELEYQTIKWDGRRIFNESLLENREGFTHLAEYEPTLGIRTNIFVNDHNITYESDDLVTPVIGAGLRKVTFTTQWEFNGGQLFYQPSDRQKTLKLTFTGNPEITYGGIVNPVARFYLVPVKESSPGSGVFIASVSDDIIIKEFTGIQSSYDYSVEIQYIIEKDYGLGYAVELAAAAGQPTTYSEQAKGVKILIEEDSEFPGSLFNTLTLAQAKDRNLEIITGKKGVLYSDLLTTGTWKDLCVSSGKMIRNLSKLNEDRVPTDTPETITTSFKDLLSVKGYLATGHGVEVHNGEERFVIEDLRHFFREDETIQLGEITDYKESAASEFYFVSGEFGNEKAGDYEEQQGRYETNAMNTYGMPTTKVTDVFDGKSNLRSDLLGAEQARRKNVTVAATEDTPYDRENFLFDCTTRGIVGYRTIKTWQQLLSARPKYVYDPDSAGNFRLTPLRSLIRWGWFLRTSLWKFGSEFIRYRSSTGFPDMVMQFPGEPERAENGEISVNDLDKELFDAKIVECSVPLNFEMYQQITGTFKDGARSVPNLYGKCVYTYQGSEPQKGWIIKAEIASVTKLTILKAR